MCTRHCTYGDSGASPACRNWLLPVWISAIMEMSGRFNDSVGPLICTISHLSISISAPWWMTVVLPRARDGGWKPRRNRRFFFYPPTKIFAEPLETSPTWAFTLLTLVVLKFEVMLRLKAGTVQGNGNLFFIFHRLKWESKLKQRK